MFTASVSGAASGMLTVCAYVIFFSTLSGTLSCLVRVCGGMEPRLFALLCGFLELSGGISEASGLPDGRQALILTAAIAGWSGLSVHCQIAGICAGRHISLRPYITAKAVQAILCGAVMALILCITAFAENAAGTSVIRLMGSLPMPTRLCGHCWTWAISGRRHVPPCLPRWQMQALF